jgi:solute:Na+ symporter, SSS family
VLPIGVRGSSWPAAGGADEFAGGGIQCLGGTVYHRLLFEAASPGAAEAGRVGGRARHRRHGADRPGLDSRDPGRQGVIRLPAGFNRIWRPPIFVVFFLGVFSKRLNAKGCLWALIVGFALGLFRLGVDTPVKLIKDFSYAEGSFLWIVNNMYFQYYSLLIFLVCIAS